jgi:hypothetical protein
MDFDFIKGLGPWAWDRVFHTKAHKLKKNNICLLYAKGLISMRLCLFLVRMKSGLGLGTKSFTLKHTNSKKQYLFIVSQGHDFHETLPLFGTYEIGP